MAARDGFCERALEAEAGRVRRPLGSGHSRCYGPAVGKKQGTAVAGVQWANGVKLVRREAWSLGTHPADDFGFDL